jgi:hypothetical protein
VKTVCFNGFLRWTPISIALAVFRSESPITNVLLGSQHLEDRQTKICEVRLSLPQLRLNPPSLRHSSPPPESLTPHFPHEYLMTQIATSIFSSENNRFKWWTIEDSSFARRISVDVAQREMWSESQSSNISIFHLQIEKEWWLTRCFHYV